MTRSYYLSRHNVVLFFGNYLRKPACLLASVAKKMDVLTAMLIVFCFAANGTAFGQGVFTSAATGDWNVAGSWTLSSGSDADGIPDADDNVTIGSANVITISSATTVECNNLTVAGGSATSLTMAGANSIVNIYGSLSATVAPSAGNYIDCTADVTAKAVFKRTTSGDLITGTWGTFGEKVRVEIDLGSSIIGTLTAAVKFRDLIVKSGTLSSIFEIRPDEGVANSGKVTIEDGAVLRCLRLSRTGTANTPFASMTMNGTAKFQPNSSVASTTNYLPVVASGFPAYTFSAASTIEYVGSSSGTISVVPYQNLAVTLANSGGSRTISAALTIAGNLTITTATLSNNAAGTTVGGNVTLNGDGVATAGANGANITGSGASNSLIVNNNGILTVVNRNISSSPPVAGTTSPFSTQYPGFETITLNIGSTVEYRVPGGTAMGTQDIQTTYGALPLNYQNLTVSLATTTASQSATQYIPDGLSIAGRLRFTINSTLATNIQDVVFNNTTALTVGSLDITRTGVSSAAIQNVKFAGQTYNVTGATTLNNSGPQFQSSSTVINFNGSVTTSGILTNQGILRFNNFEPTINFNNNFTDGAAAATFSVSGTEVPVINFNNGTSGTPMTTSGAVLRGAVTVSGYRQATGNVTINNALTLDSGTLATGANTLTLKGATSGSGLIDTGASGTLVYNGAVAQTVSNLTASTANNLTINNAAGVTVGADATVNNNLTITSGSLTVVSGKNLTVGNAIVNAGTLTIENNANLIQVNNVANMGLGNTIVKRNSSPLLRLDYTLWSSPVASQNLAAFSPLTSLAPSRFYTFDTTFNTGGVNGAYAVITDPTIATFSAGAGYLIRMPNTADAGTPTAYAGQFTGIPNNGDVPVSLVDGAAAGLRFNLVGNPYPSTLKMQNFVFDNTANIENTLWFWRKTNGAGTAYCTWQAGALVTDPGTFVTNGNTQTVDPQGIIQTAQGFFVEAKSGATSLTFKNNQRVANNVGQFFKTKQVVASSKIWLNATNVAGDFSQMAITYFDGATVGVDAFDGKYINDSAFALTSNVNNGEYTIQGRPTFDSTDVVALNFKTELAGDYTIAIDHTEGVFASGQDIYLVDSKTGTETNLTTSAYNFTAVAGVDNTRFSLKYQKTLKVDDAIFNQNSVTVYAKNGSLYISSVEMDINTIQVFDVQGRLIAERKNVKATSAIVDNLKANNQVLLVKVSGENNQAVTKKVMN